jgi:HK97 gp10 family phage protein
MSSASWSSDLGTISARAESKVDRAVEQSAERIKGTAKTLVGYGPPTTHIRDTIRVGTRALPSINREVVAGSRKAFYGWFLERGTVHMAARPFMTPAAEMERASGKLRRDVKDAFDA